MWFTSKDLLRDFPNGPVIKNAPCNAGETPSTPGLGTKISHAVGQLSPHVTNRESMHHNKRSHMKQLRDNVVKQTNIYIYFKRPPKEQAWGLSERKSFVG